MGYPLFFLNTKVYKLDKSQDIPLLADRLGGLTSQTASAI